MDEAIRQLVCDRAGNRCEYCLLPQKYAPVVRFHVEHIRARQHGGDDAPVNLALACPHCNRFKGPNLTSFDPETDTLVPLFNPRTQLWHEHFVLADLMVVGLTPIGRATIRLLHMNAADRLKVRAVLKERGELEI
jgi:5-methylcytosine-specific restriction endonuclease McrA